MSSEADENGGANSSLDFSVNREGRKEQRGNCFGAKRVREKEQGDSPYIGASEEIERDNLGYFIEKVDDILFHFINCSLLCLFHEFDA